MELIQRWFELNWTVLLTDVFTAEAVDECGQLKITGDDGYLVRRLIGEI